jgi:hypothetical protein
MSRRLLFATLGALVAAGCGGDRTQTSPATDAVAERAARGTFAAVGPEGKPLAAGVAVYAPGKHDEPLWEGLTGDKYELEPGEYDVLVEYFGQQYWRRGIKLAGGEETFKLPMGTLAVEARSSRGDRLEGAVTVFPPGRADGPPFMEGGTFESLAVLAGTYDVRVTVQGRERWIRGLSVEAGDVETRTSLEPVGYLRAEVVDQDGEPLEAEVWVYGPASSRKAVAAGTSGQPLALLPGRYDVAVRWAGTREFSAGVAVLVNQTTVERFTFWRSEAS